MELISVIVPVYNTEKYVRRCVESILGQSYRDLEIILVDDGSQDSSGKICEQLAAEDGRVKVIRQANSGVSAARNAGLDAANGEYITFADSDDYMSPGMIRRLYEILRENGAGISSCEYTSDESELGAAQDAAPIVFDAAGGIGDMLCNRSITYAVCTKLFTRSIINNLRFCTEYSHNEDLLFCYEAFLNAEKVVHTKEKLYLYYINPDSAVRSAFSHKRMTALDVQERILSDIGSRYPGSELYKTAVQQFLKVNIYTGMQMAEAGYSDKADNRRIRKNIRSRYFALLTGDLASGYKLNGSLLAFAPGLVKRRIRKP